MEACRAWLATSKRSRRATANTASTTPWAAPLIAPAIAGGAVNLTPPTTMLAALVGGAAAGVPGALVATPLLGAAKALYLERQGKLPPPRGHEVLETLQRRWHRLRARLPR